MSRNRQRCNNDDEGLTWSDCTSLCRHRCCVFSRVPTGPEKSRKVLKKMKKERTVPCHSIRGGSRGPPHRQVALLLTSASIYFLLHTGLVLTCVTVCGCAVLPLRPTQPPILGGMGSEYWPRSNGIAMQLER